MSAILSASRVAQRWLMAYQTKSGQDIELSLGPAKTDDRGWTVQTAHAKVGGAPVGYLKFGYIPKAEFDRLYPTAVHYVGLIEGRLLDGVARTPTGVRDAMLKILRFDPMDPITTRKLINLFEKKYGESYRSFVDYHVDKPQIEYIKSEVLRQGVGIALYEYTARMLAKRGLSLWSSLLQEPEAKAVWATMVSRGYPVKAQPSRWHGTRLTLGY
jgi:hypothetical protein